MSETADQLRERLRNARRDNQERERNTSEYSSITASSTSSDIERYTPNIPNQDGHSVQPVSRPGIGTVGVVRAISNAKRELADISGSLAQVNNGKRRNDRRSSQNNEQSRPDGRDVSGSTERSSSGSNTVRQVGNLETESPIPPREFDSETDTTTEKPKVEGTAPARKRGRPRKERDNDTFTAPEVTGEKPAETRKVLPFLRGNTLSKQEAKELKDPLISALQDEFAIADRMLWNLVGDPLEQPIWSDITEKEMDSLTNIILKLGQKSPAVATVARTAVDGSDYVTAATVMLPRFQKTVEVIKVARKKKQSENQNKQSAFERVRERRKQALKSTT